MLLTKWLLTIQQAQAAPSLTGGPLWLYGSNTTGQLGDSTTGDEADPQKLGSLSWNQLSVGNGFTVALRSDAKLFTWGINNVGQLGNSDTTLSNTSSPVQIGTSSWSSVSARERTAYAIRSDGTLFAWGNNFDGELGQNTILLPSRAYSWSQLATGVSHSLGIRSDGSLWAWGGNTNGELGLNDRVHRSSAVQVGSNSYTQIAAGIQSLAIDSNGVLYAWGLNTSGVLGNQATTAISSPTQIGSSLWTQVSASLSNSAALDINGLPWVWGANTGFQVGDGTNIAKSSPVQVTSLTTEAQQTAYATASGITVDFSWMSLSVGNAHSAGIRSDGTLWTWGDNAAGQLGDGTTIGKSSPIPIGAGISWTQVSAGTSFTVGLDSDNIVYTWGLNSVGQLGDNTIANKSNPVQLGLVNPDGYWSVSFPGNNNALIVASSSTFDLGLQDFTIEAWIFPIGGRNGRFIVDNGNGSKFLLRYNSGSALQFYVNSGLRIDYSVSLSQLWYQVAVVRSGTTYTMYLNGVSVGTGTNSDNITNTGSTLIGGYGPGSDFFGGYISNTRIVKGIAVYTGNFTVPTSPLAATQSADTNISAITGTETILLTCQSQTFIDNSSYGFSVTNSNASIIPTNPFGIPTSATYTQFSDIAAGTSHALAITTFGSLYAWGLNTSGQLGDLTGTNKSSPVLIGSAVTNGYYSVYFASGGASGGPYLDCGNSSVFSFGSNDLTIEFWFYATEFTQGAGFISKRNSSTSRNSFTVYFSVTAGNKVGFDFTTSGSTTTSNTIFSDPVSLNTWYHYSACRQGSTQYCSINGVVLSDACSASAMYNNTVDTVYIGRIDHAASSGQYYFKGYISNMRVLKGTALYTSNFTPSTTPLTAIANTILLTCQSSTFIDYATPPNTITATRLSSTDPLPTINRKIPFLPPANSITWNDISAGAAHSVGLQGDNTLYGWGLNTSGQIGDGSVISKSAPVQITSLSTLAQVNAYATLTGQTQTSWTQVSYGTSFALAISQSGQLYAWGQNTAGQLGTNDLTNRSSPVLVSTSSFSVISAGVSTAAAITIDGILFTWGLNSAGQLGTTDILSRSSPTQVGTSSWTTVSVGNSFITAITNNGLLYAWGLNTAGYLGLNNTANRSSPIQVGSSSWTSVSAGGSHVVATKLDGTLFTWGVNTSGQLGDSSAVTKSSPVQITTLSTLAQVNAYATLTGQSQTLSWTQVSYGTSFALAIDTVGKLYAWGVNDAGQLGTGDTVNRSSPTPIGTNSYTQISAGGSYSMAIDTTGQLWAWGLNSVGQLGDSSLISKPSPAPIGLGLNTSNYNSVVYNTISQDYLQLAANAAYAIATSTTPFTVEAWVFVSIGTTGGCIFTEDGGNAGNPTVISFMLDNGTNAPDLNNLFLNLAYHTGSGWVIAGVSTNTISTGVWTHCAGVFTGSTTLIFINGINVTNTSSTPATSWGIVGSSGTIWYIGKRWDSAAPNTYFNGYISNFRFVNGTAVYTNNFTPSTSPLTAIANTVLLTCQSSTLIDNSTIGATVSAGGSVGTSNFNPFNVYNATQTTSWSQISAGQTHVLGITSTGSLFAWGLGTSGQLGLNAATSRSSPTQVGLSSWTTASAGNNNSVGTTNNGLLFTWGLGTSGQLGDGSVVSKSSPVQITTLSTLAQVNAYATLTGQTQTSWTQVSYGTSHALAIDTVGRLYAWGLNNVGQLGTGTLNNTSSPVVVDSTRSYSQISAGNSYSLAIDTVGQLWTWGLNTSGQLGFNDRANNLVPAPIGFTGTAGYNSVNFNGSTDYLTAPVNAAFTFGTGDFTVEFWVYYPPIISSTNNGKMVVDARPQSTNGSYWAFGATSTGIMAFTTMTTGGITIYDTISRPNQWVHFAATRSGTSLRLFANGTQVASATNSDNILSSGLFIGTNAFFNTAPETYWLGYISNVRIVKGQAIYTSNFTPSTTPLTTTSQGATAGNVSLLTCQSTTFVDNSTNNFTITTNGSPGIRAYNPFGFNGTQNTSWSQVSAGNSFVQATNSTGLLFAWGLNTSGQLGDGSVVTKSSPVQITTLSTLAQVNAYATLTGQTQFSYTQVSYGTSFALAINNVGRLYAWGLNNTGQLGTNNTSNASSPVLLGTSSWSVVSAGVSTAAAITVDGKLFVWGLNNIGQLGTTDIIARSSPVQLGTTSWTNVSVGGSFIQALTTTNLLYAWGLNNSGQLGLSDLITRSSPVQIGTSSWSAISSGGSHAAALRLDGGLFTWGLGTSGQLGNALATSRSSPVQIGTSSWSAIAAGGTHTVALRSDRLLFTWGLGTSGQLGNALATSRSSPVQIGTSSWTLVSANNDFSMSTTSNNLLYTWGLNTSGQLGDSTLLSRSSPVYVGVTVSPSWAQVSMGSRMNMAIDYRGFLWTWSNNTNGNLGTNDTRNRSQPTQIGSSSWIFVSASNNGFNGFAIRADGTLWGIGGNDYGQLGTNDTVYKSSPVQIGTSSWTTVAAGSDGILAIDINGKLYSWGFNTYGELGLNDRVHRSSPTQVGTSSWLAVNNGLNFNLAISSTGGLYAWGRNDWGQLGQNNIISRSSPVQIGTGSWSQVSAGYYATLAIDINKKLWTWGNSQGGVLGDPALIDRSSPVQVGNSNWVQVNSNGYNGQGLLVNGLMYTWGGNAYGSLGLNTLNQQSSPTLVGTLSFTGLVSRIGDITMGAYRDTSISDTTTRNVFVWGNNQTGQLGQNNIVPPNVSSPIQLGNAYLAGPTTLITSWSQISAGPTNAAGISQGQLYSWGDNTIGQLGNLRVISTSSPAFVKTINDSFASIVAGGTHSAVLRSDKLLFAWGLNTSGQLGDITVVNKSYPTQIAPTLGTDSWMSWNYISAGGTHTVATRSDNLLFTWGINTSGQLGTNDLISRSSPTQIATSNFTLVKAGDAFSQAVTPDYNNTLYAWGLNTSGQLGDGTIVTKSSPVIIAPNLASWAQVSVGEQTLALDNTGYLWGWGRNNVGQLGQNDNNHRSSPVQIGTSRWSMVAVYGDSSGAIRSDGTLWTWGSATNGSLGLNDLVHRSSPTQVGTSSWTAIYAAGGAFIVLSPNRQMFVWGNNTYGSLGTNDTIHRSSPVQIGTSSWSTISSGGSGGITIDGRLFVWGRNLDNFGTGLGTNDRFSRSSPTQIGTSSWTQITFGNTSGALTVDGILYTWGDGNSGGLGNNDTTNRYRSSPIQIGTSSWSSIKSYGTSMAGIVNNLLFVWGSNQFGTLGLNIPTGSSRSSPTQVGTSSWSFLPTALNQTFGAITTNGSLFTWGLNTNGQLGDNTVADKSSPVQIASTNLVSTISFTQLVSGLPTTNNAAITVGQLYTWGDNAIGQLGNLKSIGNTSSPTFVKTINDSFTSIAAGGTHSVAVRSDNLLFTWGLGTSGQLGDLTVANKSNPIQVGSSSWTIIRAGDAFTDATTTGALFAWGLNTSGQLGDGSIISKSSPVQIGTVANTTGYNSVYFNNSSYLSFPSNAVFALGSGNFTIEFWAYNNSLGTNNVIIDTRTVNNNATGLSVGFLATTGSLYLFSSSQLVASASGTSTNIWYHVAVVRSGTTITGYINGSSVFTLTSSQNFSDTSCRIGANTNATTFMFGYVSNVRINVGQALYTGTFTPSTTPLTTTSQSSTAGNVSLLTCQNGTIIDNSNNNLTITGVGSPNTTLINPFGVGTLPAGNSFTQVASGTPTTNNAGITSFQLYTWGDNRFGQLGILRTAAGASSPTFVKSINDSFVSIGAGGTHSSVLRSDRLLFAWGLNTSGQLGDLTVVTKSSAIQIGTSSWTVVRAGDAFTYAQINGALFTWGLNTSGQLGDGSLITKSSPVQIGTVANATGYNSVFFNGSSDYLSLATTGLSTTGSFTIELWVYMSSVGGVDPVPIYFYGNTTSFAGVRLGFIGTSFYLLHSTNGTSWAVQSGNLSTGLSLNAWTHIAIVRNVNAGTIYFNGSSIYTFTWSTLYAGPLNFVGAYQNTSFFYWPGYISNLRIVNSAVYTANFTPPTGPLTAIANTVLLTCQSGTFVDNATPANTITRVGNPYTVILNPFSISNLAAGNSFTQIASGTPTTNNAGIVSGQLYTWGNNNFGQLGIISNLSGTSSPTFVKTINDSFNLIAAGGTHSVTLRSDNLLFTYGLGTSGQLGDLTALSKSNPLQIGSSSWTIIAAGDTTTAGTINGTLYTWGLGTSGQLGNDTITSRSSPVQIGSSSYSQVALNSTYSGAIANYRLFMWGTGNTGQLGRLNLIATSSPTFVKSVSDSFTVLDAGTGTTAGTGHTLGIRSDKLMYTWGINTQGQLGTGDILTRSFPVSIGTSSWTTVSTGYDYTLAVNSNKGLFAWGLNTGGALGTSDVIGRSSPVQISSLRNIQTELQYAQTLAQTTYSWTTISAGGQLFSGAAIRNDGSLWMWGNNTYGSLGTNDTISRSSPVQIGTSSWLAVSTGRGSGLDFTIAVRLDGALFAWGDNSAGQLGTVDLVLRSSPVQIGTSSWSNVSAGGSHSIALRSDRTLFAWGGSGFGQLGLSTITHRSSPTQVGTSSYSILNAGASHTLVTRSDGALFGWGGNALGQLGLNDIIHRSSPVQIRTALTQAAKVSYIAAAGYQAGDWAQTAQGYDWMLAIDKSGFLFAWGQNANGQLGLGDRVHRSSPVQIGTSTYVSISAGYIQSMAVRSDGGLFTWGGNSSGELGILTITSRSSPVQIGTSSWSMVMTGSISNSSFAKRIDGTLFAWGDNNTGQLGQNDNIARSSPVQIGTSSWTTIGVGNGHVLGLIGNSLYAWGWNNSGQLGANSMTVDRRSSPVQVGNSSWSAVAAGVQQSLGITTDGNLFAWGNNNYGQLGLNDINIHRSSPTQVGTGNSWTTVNAGVNISAGIRSGGLYTWGDNNFVVSGNVGGQLGTNDIYQRSSPTQIGTSSWTSLASSFGQNMNATINGVLYTWGYNYVGQLGQNNVTQLSSPVIVGGLTESFVSVGAGFGNSLLVRGDRLLFGMGQNANGEIGNTAIVSQSNPVQVGSSSWNFVSAGNTTTMGISINNLLFAWGLNTSSQLGINTATSVSSPVQVGTSSWSLVSTGNSNPLALTSGGGLNVWGTNTNGAIGNNTVVGVFNAPYYISYLVNDSWTNIAATNTSTNRTTAGLRLDGILFTWGTTTVGKLGTALQTDNRSFPTQIGSSSWTNVSVGGSFMLGTVNNLLYAWGDNTTGQLGITNAGLSAASSTSTWLISYSSPVQLGSDYFSVSPVQIGTSSWSQISSGTSHALGISNNRLFAWGYNLWTQLGTGDNINRSSPVQIGTSSWSQVSAGDSHSIGIDSNNQLYAWGAIFGGSGNYLS